MANKKNERDEVIKENTKKASWDIFLDYAPYIIIILFVIIIRTFIATPVKVNGSSMYPTLNDGDHMILYKLTKNTRGIKRFDIVVIKTDSGRLIKRVIGLPNETIKYEVVEDENHQKIANLYINGEKMAQEFIDEQSQIGTCNTDWNICKEEYKIPEGEYFVMGDNRSSSKDSRVIGSVAKSDILGTTNLIIFPFNRFGKVK